MSVRFPDSKPEDARLSRPAACGKLKGQLRFDSLSGTLAVPMGRPEPGRRSPSPLPRRCSLAGVIVFFLQIDTLTQKNSSRDNHLQNWLSRTACAFGAD